MTFFSFSKNKIAIPIRGRFSAAFTAVTAGAMPSVNVKDVQQEGKRAPPTPLTHSREREFLREGSDKAEHEMADNQGFCGLTNLSELLACLALAALLSFWDQGQCALSKGQGGGLLRLHKQLGLQPTQEGLGKAEDGKEMVSPRLDCKTSPTLKVKSPPSALECFSSPGYLLV